jgi:hypothetical protein
VIFSLRSNFVSNFVRRHAPISQNHRMRVPRYPQHPKALLEQRRSAREQRLLTQFLAISPRAVLYRAGLEAKRVDARAHLRKIVALLEMHGRDAVARALDDGLELQAFSAEYIAHILAARRRIGEEPGALQLTRGADLLELELPAPDLSIYDRQTGGL